MTPQVLVPVDGSDPARSAAAHAVEQFPDAEITLLYVIDPMSEYSRTRSYPGYTDDDEFTNEREKAEHILESVRNELPSDIDVRTEIEAGNPGRTIVAYSDDNDVSHIVIGSHGRQGAARYLLGSVAEVVVRRSAAPVTVIRSN